MKLLEPSRQRGKSGRAVTQHATSLRVAPQCPRPTNFSVGEATFGTGPSPRVTCDRDVRDTVGGIGISSPARGLRTATAVGNDGGVDITCITVDCTDPATVASFWNEALGWGGVAVADGSGGAICGPRSGGWYLEFVCVPEVKIGKNRVHLGCSIGALDAIDHEIERLSRLGATVAWEEEFPPEIAATYRNVVLRDPEGNEFCLGGGIPPS